MRLTTIDEVREQRERIPEAYRHITLSRLNLTENIGEAYADGAQFSISKRAIQQLCGLLGIPFNFALLMTERMPDIWKQMSDRLLSNSSMPVTVKIDPESQEIAGLFQEKEEVISLQRFLHIADRMYGAIKDFAGVANMIVDISHESSTAFFFMPNEFSPIRKDFTDVFRYGVGFSSSSVELYSPSISESLYRMICTNLTFAPTYGGKRFRTRREENILNSVGALLEDPEGVGRYAKILEELCSTMISYREAEEIYKVIDSVDGVDPEEYIPLALIAGCYGYPKIENVPSSPSWKSSARTPLSAYEAINQLTAIGSKENTTDNKTKLDLLMYAGKLMFKKKWDLKYLAPQDVRFDSIVNESVA